MVMLWAVPTLSVPKTRNQRTVGHLISYSNDSESDNPPPDSPITLHSHLTSILYMNTVISCQSCPFTVISHQPWPCTLISSQPGPARSSQVNPALANWHSIESATCHTSKTPKLVFNPETEQCFCLKNQLILTLILYV